jgi:uncharacterized protein (TIGR02284 family)
MNMRSDSSVSAGSRRPRAKREPAAEVSGALAKDHEALTESLERLVDFVSASDMTCVRDEWALFEPAVLRHIDAEQEFLLPAFEQDDPQEAKAIRAEHATIREMLGEIGLALELHVLRQEQVVRLQEFLVNHAAREASSLYTWASAERNRLLARSALRRIGRFVALGDADPCTKTLVGLVETCRDSEQGYRHAAADTPDAGHRLVFERYATERGAFATALEKRLEQLGLRIAPYGTVLGAVHRGWLDASSALADGGPRSILRECARGEEAAQRVYAAALRASLPPDLQEMVQDQYEGLRAAQSEMQALLGMERAQS